MPKKRKEYKDKGIRSRKFGLAVFSLLLITGTSAASFWFPAAATILPTYLGGILGVLGLYFAGNVSNKYVAGKVQVASESKSKKG